MQYVASQLKAIPTISASMGSSPVVSVSKQKASTSDNFAASAFTPSNVIDQLIVVIYRFDGPK